MNETVHNIPVYQELFDYMANEHDKILLSYEMADIVEICKKITNSLLMQEQVDIT